VTQNAKAIADAVMDFLIFMMLCSLNSQYTIRTTVGSRLLFSFHPSLVGNSPYVPLDCKLS
jgi:hypothetical protein